MSNLVYPVLAGLGYEGKRVYEWKTKRQEAVSGKRSALAYRQYPLVRFELTYELLRDDLSVSDLKTLVGFFNAHNGGFDTFLYNDPDFNSVTLQSFGTGNGTRTAWPLVARYQNPGGAGADELVQNFNGTPQIFNGGVLQTVGLHYSLGPTGIVTFTSAPANGNALQWTGGFYYRCEFMNDMLDDLSEFMDRWWRGDSVVFRSIKL